MKLKHASLSSFFIIFACCLISSCSDPEDDILDLNQPFIINFNETVRLNDEIELELYDVDERRCCACSVGSSYSEAFFKVYHKNHFDTFSLFTTSCAGIDDCGPCIGRAFYEIHGLKILMLKLFPYPSSAYSPYPMSDYQATMKILLD